MLYSDYWNNLVNYDQAAVGGYPDQYQFWFVVLPHFMNEVVNRHSKGFFNTDVWVTTLPTNDRMVICPRNLLRFDTHGVFITVGSTPTSLQPGYEIIPNNDIPWVGPIQEASTVAGYPSSYRMVIAKQGEVASIDPIYGDMKLMILNRKPVAGLWIRATYITRPPIPNHPGGTWTDTDLSYNVPDQLIPLLVIFHRAYIYGDREAGNKDTRFDRQMKRFYAALETIDSIITAGPRHYGMVGSN